LVRIDPRRHRSAVFRVCCQSGKSGVTIPILENDGQPLNIEAGSQIVSAKYAGQPSQQSFIAVGDEAFQDSDSSILSSFGWLKPYRLETSKIPLRVFVYPHRDTDPSAADVRKGFQINEDGFSSILGTVSAKLYHGRTSAGGEGDGIDLDSDGSPDVRFSDTCRFALQLKQGDVVAAEADRHVVLTYRGMSRPLEAFRPISFD
jgi:hypothetical protein